MEINTEINRVFGEEMAKIFAGTISDEEILCAAKSSWKALNKSNWGQETRIDAEVKTAILDRVSKEITAILETEEAKSDIKETAQRILEQIREKATEKIVENVSDRVASLYTGYQGFGLESMIASVVQDMLRR